MNITKYLKNNKLYFNLIKRRYNYYTSYTNEVPNEYKDVFNTLVKDGVVTIPNFISNDVIDQILIETDESLNRVIKNDYDDTKHFYFPNYGIYQVHECEKISPASNLFFQHDMINKIAAAYVWKNVSSYQKMIEVRPDPGRESVSDVFHFDDWRHRFKAFLYLTDVNENHAPFVYLKGSHIPGKWRERKEYEYYRDGKIGSYGSFFMQEVNHLKSTHNFQETMCLGKKGTLILTDTRGLHKGTPLVSGKRILLANFFGQRKSF